MARLFVDLSPLRRHPAFRRMWLGGAVSSVGSQLSVVAVAYEVYHLTGSDLDVGLISLVQLVPTLVGSLLGGAVADAMDRRTLLLLTGGAMAVTAAGMAFDVSRAKPSILVLYVLAGAGAAFQGVNNPTQNALMLSLVSGDMMIKANALRQLSNQVSSVLGPSLAGVLIAAYGTRLVFYANAASFLVAMTAVVTVGARRPVGGTTRFGWRSIAEGFTFLKGRPAITGCLVADFSAMVLGMPTALFPAMAATHFHGGARSVGLLYAAPGIGACVGAALSGWTSRVRRPGRAICVAGVFWGLALVAFGLSDSIALAVACLGAAGAADMVAAIFRGTIVQTEAPDRLRGRLSAIQTAVVSSGPRLGNTEAGLVAAATSAQFSVVSGGVGCLVAVGLLALLLPRFVTYELPREELVATMGP